MYTYAIALSDLIAKTSYAVLAALLVLALVVAGFYAYRRLMIVKAILGSEAALELRIRNVATRERGCDLKQEQLDDREQRITDRERAVVNLHIEQNQRQTVLNHRASELAAFGEDLELHVIGNVIDVMKQLDLDISKDPPL